MQYRIEAICKGCWHKVYEFDLDTATDQDECQNVVRDAQAAVLDHREDCPAYWQGLKNAEGEQEIARWAQQHAK